MIPNNDTQDKSVCGQDAEIRSKSLSSGNNQPNSRNITSYEICTFYPNKQKAYQEK